MAFADSGAAKTIVQGWFPCKVTIARDCEVGDIIGPAEDDLSADWGPINADEDGHATTVTYLARLVAGQSAVATAIITAYPIAVVQGSGLTGGFADEKMSFVYAASSTTGQGTSSICGKLTPTEATGDGFSSVIGIQVDTDRVLLFPGFRAPEDALSTD